MNNNFTIYIPTYNRSNQLYKLTKFLLNYNFINIHIFDNSEKSLIENKSFQKFKKKNNFKYNKNSKNLGLVGNFNEILENIESKYFMILADDDFINISFVKKALSEFDNNNELAWVGSKSLIYNVIDRYYYFVGHQLKNKNYHFDVDYKKYDYNLRYNIPLCSIIFNSAFVNKKIRINNIGDDRSLLFKISLNNKYKLINSVGGIFTLNESSFSYNGGFSNFNKEYIKFSKKEEIKEILNYTHINNISKNYAIKEIEFFYKNIKSNKKFKKFNIIKRYLNLLYNLCSLKLASVVLSNFRKNILD